MKQTKPFFRILSFTAAVLMLFPLVACKSEPGKEPTPDDSGTTAPADTTAPIRDIVESNLPDDLDFNGETVTFLSRSYYDDDGKEAERDSAWSYGEISVEELTNDPVNDAVYNRNIKVEDQLGITIKEVPVPFKQNMIDMIRADNTSGDGQYDVVCGSVFYQTPLIFEGLFYDLNSNGIDTYLDLSQPWWSQLWIEEATMGDRLYCVTGSMALSLKRLLFVTYFNKSMAENEGLENMYDVVRSGRWTVDYLSETAKGLYRDLNGDDNRDQEDQYGYIMNHYECADIYWSCFDLSLLAKDEENWYTLNTNPEKLSNAFETVFSLIYENQGTYDLGDTNGFAIGREMFADGHALFASLHLRYAESEMFRNGMQDDYGILPEPKYDEAQNEYYSYAHDQYTVFMVPAVCKHPEVTGAALEAMACESYNSVDVAYFDNALKGRYSNDPDTRQMLDIIVDGFKIDAGWIYAKTLAEPTAALLRSLIYGKSRSFATVYAKVERNMPYILRDLRKNVEKFDY